MMFLIILLLPFLLLAAPPFIFHNYEAFERPFFRDEAAFKDTVFKAYSFESINLFRGGVNYQSPRLDFEYRSWTTRNRLIYRIFQNTTLHLLAFHAEDRLALKAASVDLHLDGDNSRDLHLIGLSQKIETGPLSLMGLAAAGLTSMDNPLPLAWNTGLRAQKNGMAFLEADFSRVRHRERAVMSGADILYTRLHANFERDSLHLLLGRDFKSGLRLTGWFSRTQETGFEDTLIFFSGTALRLKTGLDCGWDIGSRRLRARVYGGFGTDSLRAHEAPGILALYAYAADTVTGGSLSLSPHSAPTAWAISAGWQTTRFNLARSRVTLSDFVKSTNRTVIRTVPAKVYADGLLHYTNVFLSGRWTKKLCPLWNLDFEAELNRLPIRAALFTTTSASLFYVVGLDQENDTSTTDVRCVWGARPALSATFTIPNRGWNMKLNCSQYVPWYVEVAGLQSSTGGGTESVSRFRFPSGFEAGLQLRSSF